MEYEGLEPIERDVAARAMASSNLDVTSNVLIRLALHDDDREWLEQTILPYLSNAHPWVRGNAAMALGHVARLHGRIDQRVVVPAIRRLLDDPDERARGCAEDALDSIEDYVCDE